MVRVFSNGPGDLGSIPGQVIPKTQKKKKKKKKTKQNKKKKKNKKKTKQKKKQTKTVLDASLLNTQHYKVWIKGEVGQSWERSSALLNTLM